MKQTLSTINKPHKNREIEQRFCPHMNANVVLSHTKETSKSCVRCLDSYNCAEMDCPLRFE